MLPDCSFMGETGKSRAAAPEKSSAMRVALISQVGTIQTMWLPDTMEGRYRFHDDLDFSLPLYIESKDGYWAAFAEKDTFFHTEGGQTGSQIVLSDQLITKIHIRGKEYALYTEANPSRNSLFWPYSMARQTDYIIGRSPESHICYSNRTVSWRHAQLHWEKNGWTLLDCGSTNGTYVNNRRITSARLSAGDVIYIMGLYILVGPGFVCMNNSNNRVVIQTQKIRRILSNDEMAGQPCPALQPAAGLFDRQPRKVKELHPEDISIELPPVSLNGNKIPFLLRMGSPMVMGGRALMTGNVAMTLTSLVFPALTQGMTEKERKEYEAKRVSVYHTYLESKKQEINREKTREEHMLAECYPELSNALHFALNKDRLWERRNTDKDFLRLRIGTGQAPLLAERKFQERSIEIEADPLKDEMYALAESPVFLDDSPITVSLQEDYIIGVLGPSRTAVGLLKNLVMQLVLTHSYDEVKLVLLAEEACAAEFDFVRYLPHTWDNERMTRFFAVTRTDALQISEYLSMEIEKLLDKDQNRDGRRDRLSYVVLALSKELFGCVERLKDILGHGKYAGVSIIAAFEGIPKECSRIIDLRGQPKTVGLLTASEEDRHFAVEGFDPALADRSMREIMRTKLLAGSNAYALPSMLTFLEMFGAGKVEHLNPLQRWAENNPVNSLSVPIGVGTDGRLFTLDLHEKRQGPHGLVAGMTGSGKSEFLISYILSMAVNFSPDEVAFILIDYKGGGLADAFENKDRGIHLPHLAGTITNLDGASIDRSLMSIKSELTRRQTIFKQTKQAAGEGTLDIYDYQKLYRNGKVSEPLPHLFIISDEFAELKQQQPMFMDELISAARIGRSLGVHLILATQKPGGVVNNQIWSNTKFRACLRVQDRSDSMEMLKRPEAAELTHTGRFYLQVGYNEYFALGQSAWCGADYFPQDKMAEERDDSIQFLDNAGKTLLSVKPETQKQPAESRQIVAVVNYLSDLARREGIQPRSLWTEPLANQLELSRMVEEAGRPDGEIAAIMGMVDDPEFQRQFPLYLHLMDFHNMLLVGTAGSGKSTLTRTLLYSLVSWYTPEELTYYIVDLSDGALNGYSRMPHCGAYLTEKETTELKRLMNLVKGIIARRKKLFKEAEVSTFEAYRKLHPIPLVLFIIDGYTKMKSLEGGEQFFVKFPEYLREGASFGVRYFVTCNHVNEVGSQARQELDARLALWSKDKYECGDILNLRAASVPPEIAGRGMCGQDGRALMYQTAMLDCGVEDADRAAALRSRLDEIAKRYQGTTPAERLPMMDAEQTYANFCAGFQMERIPLGYAVRDMRPVAIPFQQLYSMSLYFGNPKGVRPVFRNLLTAAERNHMDVIVMRRTAESVFDREALPYMRYLDTTPEGLRELLDIIWAEVAERNRLRDEYSIQQGIPLTAKGRARKAARYIRAHSKPLLILLECFADFCRVEKEICDTTEGTDLVEEGKYTVFFTQMRGYNIYFAAGFYPTDDISTQHPMRMCYNKEEFLLLFGGRYNRIPIDNIPYHIVKHEQIAANYNEFLMKYHDEFYSMIMPCGKLQEEITDPDEAPIL